MSENINKKDKHTQKQETKAKIKNTLKTECNKIKEDIFNLGYDISSSFLPDTEIVKNIIRTKNPKYTEDDLDIMVDGDYKDNDDTQNTDNYDIKAIRKKQRKERVKELATSTGLYPLPNHHALYDECKKMKDDVREKAMLLVKEQKSLIQDINKAGSKIALTISGSSIMTAPLSFNLPMAMSNIMTVISDIQLIIDRAINIITNLDPLSNLIYLVGSDKYKSISTPIMTSLKSINIIIGAVSMLKKLISKLASKMSKKPDKSTKKSLEKFIKDNEIEMVEIAKEGDDDLLESKKKQIQDLKNRLIEFENGYDIPNINEDGDIISPDEVSLLEKLGIEVDINDINNLNTNLVGFLYDVYFNDGSVMTDVTEEELEELKTKYDLIFN